MRKRKRKERVISISKEELEERSKHKRREKIEGVLDTEEEEFTDDLDSLTELEDEELEDIEGEDIFETGRKPKSKKIEKPKRAKKERSTSLGNVDVTVEREFEEREAIPSRPITRPKPKPSQRRTARPILETVPNVPKSKPKPKQRIKHETKYELVPRGAEIEKFEEAVSRVEAELERLLEETERIIETEVRPSEVAYQGEREFPSTCIPCVPRKYLC